MLAGPHLLNLVIHLISDHPQWFAGTPIRHQRGLRQGDPLLTMLFILAIDPIQKIFEKATEQGILSPIGSDPIRIRTSLYADDASLFIKPTQQDFTTVQRILAAFRTATGLEANIRRRYNKLAVVNLH